jgi:hypothetical protein
MGGDEAEALIEDLGLRRTIVERKTAPSQPEDITPCRSIEFR